MEINKKKLRKELAEAKRNLELSPDFLEAKESVARCLHWLGDPEAPEYLRQVADRLDKAGAPGLLMGGYFYRLLGEQGKALRCFKRAYKGFAPRLEQMAATHPEFEEALYCAFLLGEYGEVEALDQQKKGGYAVVKLARACRTRDANVAGEAVEELAQRIRRYRSRLSETHSGLHPWDRYEIALGISRQLNGSDEPSMPPGQGSEQAPRVRLSKEQVLEILEKEEDEPDLHAADLSDMDLSDVVVLDGVIFVDADLRGANLSGTSLVDTNFTGADMRGVKLVGVTLQDTLFKEVDLSGTDLSEIALTGGDFPRANLRNASLRGSDLSHVDLSGVNLTGADLRGANLENADLEGAIMDDILR